MFLFVFFSVCFIYFFAYVFRSSSFIGKFIGGKSTE